MQAVWQPGAAQPPVQPDDETPEAAEQLSPDDAARTLFSLLKAPDAPAVAQDQATVAVEPPAAPVPGAAIEPRLTRDDVRRLQSALHELRECRELIDQALKDEAA